MCDFDHSGLGLAGTRLPFLGSQHFSPSDLFLNASAIVGAGGRACVSAAGPERFNDLRSFFFSVKCLYVLMVASECMPPFRRSKLLTDEPQIRWPGASHCISSCCLQNLLLLYRLGSLARPGQVISRDPIVWLFGELYQAWGRHHGIRYCVYHDYYTSPGATVAFFGCVSQQTVSILLGFNE